MITNKEWRYTKMETTRLMTVSEVAGRLRVSPLTVYRLIWDDKLDAMIVGRQYRISERQVDDYTDSRKGK